MVYGCRMTVVVTRIVAAPPCRPQSKPKHLQLMTALSSTVCDNLFIRQANASRLRTPSVPTSDYTANSFVIVAEHTMPSGFPMRHTMN